jgi:peptide-methionine (R)-S-oxide reductase
LCDSTISIFFYQGIFMLFVLSLTDMASEIIRSDEEWKKRLTSQAYHVLRKKGTEPAFTGKYVSTSRKGTYRCAGCGHPLFHSDAKFDSGTGWPSFRSPIKKNSVETKLDAQHDLQRTEVLCSRCGSHLGHVFTDGPPPTNLRFCINSIALQLDEKIQDDTVE